MNELEGKAFVVGGSATGIGAATVKRLVGEGAKVVAADINRKALDEMVAAIGAPERLRGMFFDLGNERDVIDLVRESVAWLGGLDGLVTVAADLAPETMQSDRDIGEMDVALWERVQRVNLIGTASLIRECLPHLRRREGGAIVVVSSVAAWLGGKFPAYASSKIGLHSLVRHTARTVGKAGIRCNAVAPGMILTDKGLETMSREELDGMLGAICLPRLGQPEDIASTAAFLLSDDARWMTGQVLSMDGGWILRE